LVYLPRPPFLSKLVEAIRREIVSTLSGFILALVAVAVGFQVPQNGPVDLKYTAPGPGENMPSQVADPVSFLLPALTGLVLALMVYVAAKRRQPFKSSSRYGD